MPYTYNLVDPSCPLYMQGEVQSGYCKRAYSFIDQRLLASVWRRPGYVRQFCAATSCYSIQLVSYHALLFELLLIDMRRNSRRTGFEVRACIVSLPHIRKNIRFIN